MYIYFKDILVKLLKCLLRTELASTESVILVSVPEILIIFFFSYLRPHLKNILAPDPTHPKNPCSIAINLFNYACDSRNHGKSS